MYLIRVDLTADLRINCGGTRMNEGKQCRTQEMMVAWTKEVAVDTVGSGQMLDII